MIREIFENFTVINNRFLADFANFRSFDKFKYRRQYILYFTIWTNAVWNKDDFIAAYTCLYLTYVLFSGFHQWPYYQA